MRIQLLNSCSIIALCLIAAPLFAGSPVDTETELEQPLAVARRDDSPECGSAGCCKREFSAASLSFICVKCCELKVGRVIEHSKCREGFCPCTVYGVAQCVKCDKLSRYGC